MHDDDEKLANGLAEKYQQRLPLSCSKCSVFPIPESVTSHNYILSSSLWIYQFLGIMPNQEETIPRRPADKQAIPSRADEVSTVRIFPFYNLLLMCLVSFPSSNYVSVADPTQSF